MTDPRWAAVDQYVDGLLVGADPALQAVLDATAAADMPAISVTPS